MSNSTQEQKANQRREKFASLLREMFQLDQPELDFGLYRIMHARKDDINRFIDEDLPSITRKAFEQFASLDKTQVEQALEQARKAAVDAGFNPEESPKVKELQAQLKDNFDLAREEGEVYDALVTFFNRYYSEGDFLSRRVYKDGTYAIPYQGEEVVLHWANKDQYYIKSSETLRDYSFRLNPNAGIGEDPMRVHFKLVDAEAGAKDNNKESADNKRVFVLDADTPYVLIYGEANEDGECHQELQLRFFYRAATAEDWTETSKKKATAAAQKKPPAQDALRSIAEERLFAANTGLPTFWAEALAKPYRKADGELAEYSTLQGQLNNYTKKNTFDYFIHKDLGGFLTRELDFYIKNELMDWADIAALKHDPARLAPLLSKIEVIRSLGEKIIAFLAQLENFQKKLWLKKKFVTETQYCLTLDRIEQHPDLLADVFGNDRQKQDWANLYKLDIKQLDKDLAAQKGEGYDALLVEPKYRYLMLDTAHFDERFKAKLLNTIDDLDEQCDGLLVHSENFQALNLLQERYREQVKCIYIDPPYNTGDDGFCYKDQYQSSSWLTSLSSVLFMAYGYLRDDGALFASIDDNEADNLKKLLFNVFGKEGHLADVVWQKRYSPDSRTVISDAHEYVFAYAKDLTRFASTRRKLPLTDAQTKQFSNPDNDDRGPWKAADFTAQGYRPNQMYEITSPNGQSFTPPPGRCWIVTKEKYEQFLSEDIMYFGRDGSGRPAVKRFLKDMDGMVPWTWWPYTEVGHSQDGLKEGVKYFGESGRFTTQKPLGLIKRAISISTNTSDVVLDFYSGSGTSADAVIRLNREESAKRKYLLAECADQIDRLIIPRLKKQVYCRDWKDGAPTFSLEANGVSHCNKYVRLESYEDALGNLALNRPRGQQSLLEAGDQSPLNEARQAYIMNYMLEVETRGSASLLNTQQFLDPTAYQLNVRSAGGDETKAVNVDLLETFNYLLGLRVEHIAAAIHFDAQFSKGEYGRIEAKVKRTEGGAWWFRTVYGKNANGQAVLVVWRNLPTVIANGDEGIQRDNAVLDAVLIEKLKIRLTESADDEIDILYVNGDHNISIPRDRKGQPMEQARLQLIEEAFHRLMFAGTESVQ